MIPDFQIVYFEFHILCVIDEKSLKNSEFHTKCDILSHNCESKDFCAFFSTLIPIVWNSRVAETFTQGNCRECPNYEQRVFLTMNIFLPFPDISLCPRDMST